MEKYPHWKTTSCLTANVFYGQYLIEYRKNSKATSLLQIQQYLGGAVAQLVEAPG